MRRTGRILKTYGHIYRTFDPVREILYIEIAEGPVKVLVAYSKLLLCSNDFISRP